MTPETTVTITDTRSMELSDDMIERILLDHVREAFGFERAKVDLETSHGMFDRATISVTETVHSEDEESGPDGFPAMDITIERKTTKSVTFTDDQVRVILADWLRRHYPVDAPAVELSEAGWGGVRATVRQTVVD